MKVLKIPPPKLTLVHLKKAEGITQWLNLEKYEFGKIRFSIIYFKNGSHKSHGRTQSFHFEFDHLNRQLRRISLRENRINSEETP